MSSGWPGRCWPTWTYGGWPTPLLRELSQHTGETAALLVWNGSETICVEQIASPHQIKHTTPLGARYNDALSASVQVFLPVEPDHGSAPSSRSGAITYPGLDDSSLDAYLVRLKDVIRRGWAVNYGETSLDEVGVAAPVYDHRGEVRGRRPDPGSPVPGAPTTGCRPWARPAPRLQRRSPPGWADARPQPPGLACARGAGLTRQASRASRVARCSAASRPESRGSPPHSSKIRRSRWCIDCRST